MYIIIQDTIYRIPQNDLIHSLPLVLFMCIPHLYVLCRPRVFPGLDLIDKPHMRIPIRLLLLLIKLIMIMIIIRLITIIIIIIIICCYYYGGNRYHIATCCTNTPILSGLRAVAAGSRGFVRINKWWPSGEKQYV